MRAIQILCPQTGQSQYMKDITPDYAIDIGKEFIRTAVSRGFKDPKAKIIVEGIGVWYVVSKKDIAPKVTKAQTLTESELALLKRIVAMYEAYGVNNTEFSTVTNKDDDTKKMRGVLASLTRKQVIYRNDCPNCFNPIYPSNTFKATCEKYGIAYGDKTKPYVG